MKTTKWRKRFSEKRRSWINVIVAAVLTGLFVAPNALGQPVGAAGSGSASPTTFTGGAGAVALAVLPGTACLGLGGAKVGESCTNSGAWTAYGDTTGLKMYYGNQIRLTGNIISGNWVTNYAWQSDAASGNNGFACSTAGCRVDLGPGANDYLHSPAGDPIITPASFQVGGNFSTNSGVNSTSSSGWFTTGNYHFGAGGTRMFLSSTAPTIGSAGTSPSVLANIGANSFRVDVGTGGTATGFTMTFPASTNRWICQCQNATDNSTVRRIVQTGYSTTTCVMEQRTVSTNAAVAFGAGDDVDCIAFPH